MMNQPSISIVIPVYNVESYITECLQSVMQQTYQGPIDCIVVDDCGTDKSVEIAEKLISEYDGPIAFRILHHEKNMGLSCARNTGVYAAIGDYIYFLDSDDVITDDCLDVLVSQREKGRFDVIVGNHDYFGNRTVGARVFPEEGLKISGEEYFLKFLFGRQVTCVVWNKLYSHEYLRKNNMLFEPGLIMEDYVFTFRLSCYPTSICVINKVTHHYRYYREGSIDCELINNSGFLRDSLVKVWDCIRNYCETEKYNEVHEMALHCYGKKVYTISRMHGLLYKDVFVRFNKSYPYHPLLIWLSGKQGYRWLISRLIWMLPPLCAFRYYELKQRIKAIIKCSKAIT